MFRITSFASFGYSSDNVARAACDVVASHKSPCNNICHNGQKLIKHSAV